MKTMPVGKLKSHFSEVIEAVKNGEHIVISYGKKKKKIAVIIPFSQFAGENGIKPGILREKAACAFSDDFEMTPEELAGE
ncbi:MAG: type II toxin-antitoxin system Phd/YefM family antitoxin [Spirochaetales bacterium]|nr:type II toxin-antitoxin system Phd/YefM family antitoxin [Spirochaetales bacterium]